MFLQIMLFIVKLFTTFVMQSQDCIHNYAESVSVFLSEGM